MSEMILLRKDTKQDYDRSTFWYTAEDELRFRHDAQDEMLAYLLLKTMAVEAGLPNSSIPTPFGMEQLKSRQYAQKRAQQKELVKIAVLREQARSLYLHESPDDDEMQGRIAAISLVHSQWSRDQARMIGSLQQALK